MLKAIRQAAQDYSINMSSNFKPDLILKNNLFVLHNSNTFLLIYT